MTQPAFCEARVRFAYCPVYRRSSPIFPSKLSNVEQPQPPWQFTLHLCSLLARSYPLLAGAETDAKENQMDILTKILLLMGTLILIVCIAVALRAIFRLRRENAAPFRGYFGPEYDRDLLEQSALSESEEWQADYGTSFTPFRLRHLKASKRR
jgi:hypothetical protein